MLIILCSLSEPVDVYIGVAESPAYWACTLLVTGTPPWNPDGVLGLSTSSREASDAWKVPCFIRTFCVRFSNS